MIHSATGGASAQVGCAAVLLPGYRLFYALCMMLGGSAAAACGVLYDAVACGALSLLQREAVITA